MLAAVSQKRVECSALGLSPVACVAPDEGGDGDATDESGSVQRSTLHRDHSLSYIPCDLRNPGPMFGPRAYVTLLGSF